MHASWHGRNGWLCWKIYDEKWKKEAERTLRDVVVLRKERLFREREWRIEWVSVIRSSK